MTPSRRWIWLSLVLLLYLGWSGWHWASYPPVWVDEGWIAEAAWTHAHTGELGSPAHGPLYRYADRLYWMPPMYFLVLSGAIRAGLDPLLAGRGISWIAGAVGLLFLLRLGRTTLWEPCGGSSQTQWRPGEMGLWLLWLALAFTTDPVLWKVHRSIRFESMTGAGILAAVASAALLRGRAAGIGMGASAALAALTHPTGALALPAALGTFFLRPGRDRGSRVFPSLLALLVTLLCLTPFLLYLAQDRGSGFANLLGQNAPHLSGREAPLPVQWLTEWRRYRAYFAWPSLVLPLLLWGGTLLVGVRLTPRWLLWVLGVLLLGLASLPNKTELYLTLAAPFVYLLAAWTGSRFQSRATAWAMAAIWLLSLVGADAALLRRDRHCDYRRWIAPLAAQVPPGASVAGTYVTWFALREHPYLEFHRRRAGDLAGARPEYILWGGEHLEDPIFARLRREMGSFLVVHAETVAVSSSLCYADLALLRPRWDELDADIASGWERFVEGDPDP